MGWTSGWGSRQAVVRDIKEMYESGGANSKILRASLVGNHLWMAMEVITESERVKLGERWIALYLLQGGFKMGRTVGTWGYKDMSESMGPAYYDCPLYMLDLVPPPDSEYSAGWRDEVRAYHRAKNRQFAPGQEIWLPEGYEPRHFVVTSNKPLRGRAFNIEEGRGFFRLPRAKITESANA